MTYALAAFVLMSGTLAKPADELPFVQSGPSVFVYSETIDGAVLPWEEGEGGATSSVSIQMHAIKAEGSYSAPAGVPFWQTKTWGGKDYDSIVKLFPGIARLRIDQLVGATVFVGVEAREYRIGAYLPGHEVPITYTDKWIKPGKMYEVKVPVFVKAFLMLDPDAKRAIGALGSEATVLLTQAGNDGYIWNDGPPFEGGFGFWLLVGREYSGWFFFNLHDRKARLGRPIRSFRIASRRDALIPIDIGFASPNPVEIPPASGKNADP